MRYTYAVLTPGFNPRARGGRDSSQPASWYSTSRCFNPRARGGRDVERLTGDAGVCVSIHAPAGGATLAKAPITAIDLVSIHAPAGGATQVTR